MSLAVVEIPTGARLVDCVTVLTASSAAALKAAGVDGAIRYLGSLTAEEADAILEAGLGLLAVGYSAAPGWTPSAALGAQRGAELVGHAQKAQLCPPLDLWIDLEGCSGDAASTAAYLDACSVAIIADGFHAGLYVGAGQPLDGAALYARPHVTGYWRSQSRGIPEPACGFKLTQLYPTTHLAGVEVDVNFAERDFAGRAPLWMVRQSSAAIAGIPLPFDPTSMPPEAR